MTDALRRHQTTRIVRPHAMDDRPHRVGALPNEVGELEKLVFARVDGRRTIGDIAGLLSLAPAEASLVIRRLIELGAVQVTAGEETDVDLDDVD